MKKIPFDIKFRPQIESGEYKVETRDGKPTRIVYWDLKGNEDFFILALVEKNEKEVSYCYPATGCCKAACDPEGKDDLFIITPAQEPLTKLEKAVFDMLVERTNEATISEKQARKYAPIFLEIAKDEIYSHESLVEYARVSREQGKAEAMKDLPRWVKCQADDPIACVYNCVKREDSLLYYNGHTIKLIDLEKLPGFKEDESHK